MNRVKIGRTVYTIINDYTVGKHERYRVMNREKKNIIIYDLVRPCESVPWQLEKVTDNIRRPAGWHPGNVEFLEGWSE